MALVCLSISLSLHAQTEKGHWLAGGSFEARIDDINGAFKEVRVGIYPSLGYFIMNNWAIGATTTLTVSKSTSNPSVAYNLGGGIFSRYYFCKGNIKPFVTAGIRTSSTLNTDNNSTFINYYGGAGLAIFLNKNISLDIQAQYRELRYINKNYGKSWGVVIPVGFQILF